MAYTSLYYIPSFYYTNHIFTYYTKLNVYVLYCGLYINHITIYLNNRGLLLRNFTCSNNYNVILYIYRLLNILYHSLIVVM